MDEKELLYEKDLGNSERTNSNCNKLKEMATNFFFHTHE